MAPEAPREFTRSVLFEGFRPVVAAADYASIVHVPEYMEFRLARPQLLSSCAEIVSGH